MDIPSLFGIRPGVTAIIGSGGKTSLMELLARELSATGKVLLCTTTKIRVPQEFVTLLSPTEAALRAAFEGERCLCAGTLYKENKLNAPQLPFSLLTEIADHVLAEADGARNLPFKAHAPWEPVVPPEANAVIQVVGASGFGKPVAEAVHRPELWCSITGAALTDPVTPALAAKVLLHEKLQTLLFINQVEDEEALATARELASLVGGRAVAGSIRRREFTCLC